MTFSPVEITNKISTTKKMLTKKMIHFETFSFISTVLFAQTFKKYIKQHFYYFHSRKFIHIYDVCNTVQNEYNIAFSSIVDYLHFENIFQRINYFRSSWTDFMGTFNNFNLHTRNLIEVEFGATQKYFEGGTMNIPPFHL